LKPQAEQLSFRFVFVWFRFSASPLLRFSASASSASSASPLICCSGKRNAFGSDSRGDRSFAAAFSLARCYPMFRLANRAIRARIPSRQPGH
jgi:hypothetical protein